MNIEDIKRAIGDVFYRKQTHDRTIKIYTDANGMKLFNEAMEQEMINMIDKHNMEILEKDAKK